MAEITSPLTGTVWKVHVEPGATVGEGDVVVVLESMKMEIPVEAEQAGTIIEVRVIEGQMVTEQQVLVVIE